MSTQPRVITTCPALYSVSEKRKKEEVLVRHETNPERLDPQTLGHLSGQGRRDGDETEVGAAVVYRHLLALSRVGGVAEALVAKVLEGVAAVHQDS